MLSLFKYKTPRTIRWFTKFVTSLHLWQGSYLNIFFKSELIESPNLVNWCFLWGGLPIFEKGGLEKGISSSFFHKMMKFYKDICFAWISNTYYKLFTRRLTSYTLQKYSRNIFNLFKCKKPNGKYWMETSHPCGKHINKTLRHPWLKAFQFHGFFHFKKWLTYEVFFVYGTWQS